MNYNTYRGMFECQECSLLVSVARLYDNLDLTWKCQSGHMSKVSLARG